MSDEDQGTGEPVSSDLDGLQGVAAELTREREERAETAQRRAARERTDEEVRQDDAIRETFRKQVDKAHEREATEEGRKLSIRDMANMLAEVRQFEATQAADAAAADVAEQPEDQQPGNAEEISEPNYHPAVKERLAVLSQHEQHMAQVAQQYQTGLAMLYEVTRRTAAKDFPDISTEADMAALAQKDPPRFARFQQAVHALFTTQHEITNTTQRQAQAREMQFQNLASQQDAAFRGRHPELNNPEVFNAAHTNTMKALRAFGLSDAEVASQYSTNPLLRDSRVQTLLYELGKQHAAREQIRRPAPRAVPQVQRPGAASARDGIDEMSEVDRLEKKYGDSMSVKQAAEILVAKRRAQKR